MHRAVLMGDGVNGSVTFIVLVFSGDLWYHRILGGETGMEAKKRLKVDIIIGAVVVGIGVILVLVYLGTRKPGARVVVSIDGDEVATYSLSETVDVIVQDLKPDAGATAQDLKPDADATEQDRKSNGDVPGRNRLVIRDGEARMEEADCPDKLCVHQGRISHTNESIVCLPHRISIRIVGEDEAPPDAIAR